MVAMSAPLLSCGGKKTLRTDSASTSPAQPATESQSTSKSDAPTDVRAPLAFEDVRFDYDKSTLRPDAQALLANHAKLLIERPQVRIQIEGHCDERGTVEYNLGLGDRRAQTVLDYLVTYGVSRDRLKTLSFGKERPLDSGHDEAAWARNRRAALVIVPGT
jgi:peptidoglycan-associated lipoprotein